MSKKQSSTPPRAAAEATPLDWALAYAAAGWAVMPVWPPEEDGGGCSCPTAQAFRAWRDAGSGGEPMEDCPRPAKHPIPKQGIKQATTQTERIRAWWDEYPEANIAIATGEASDCIVIDVDTGGAKAGDVSITTATAEHGGVPRTLKAQSGSGGRHYVYRYRATPYTRKIGFLKDVDYLADGGYVIVQPSVNMKGPYRWDAEAGVTTPAGVASLRQDMAELPDWFDKLEGTGRTGKKSDKRQRADAALRARMVNAAAMEFKPSDPRWVAMVGEALTACDPDSRDDWVLFGIVLGREFERNDDGWRLYSEWSSRSAKFADKGTEKAMRTYYYDDSNAPPQGGEPATIATIFRRAQEAGWALPVGGVDERPVLVYRKGRAMEACAAVITLLAREREAGSDEQRVYAFGSGLGSIVEGHDFGVRYSVEGRPPMGWVRRVVPYTPMSIGSRVTHTATIVSMSAAGSAQQVECPSEVSTLLLSGYNRHFPRLNGIVQWPMVIDRKVAGFEEEYEARAGLVFALPEGLDFSELKGTKKEAQAAWKWVREVALDQFPFDTERDWSAALALMLTFVQRRAMEGAPAFLVTAPIQGSGKTALVRFCSRAIHGRSVGAGPLSAQSEEQRKAITAALMSNPPCLLWDNLQAGSSFDSAELAIAMTSGEWEDRRLGSTERLTLPNRAVWCFTGNNISLKADLRRRFVTVRMRPQERNHHEQNFRRNLDTWPIENRTAVLRALTAILLWGSRCDATLPSESGFKEWDAEVRRVVLALTGIDPFLSLTEQGAEDADDDETEAEAALCVAWVMLCGDERRTVAEFVERAHDAKKSSDPARRRAAEAVEGAVGALRGVPVAKLQGSDFGYAFRTLKDKPLAVNGVDLAFQVVGQRSKVAVWHLMGSAAFAATLDGGL